MNDYEDFKGLDKGDPITRLAITQRKDWPRGAVPRDDTYSLECSRAMRPLMADDDTSAENFQYGTDGEILWVPVDAVNYNTEKPELTRKEGTYALVAALATKMNSILDSNGPRTWNYTPVLIAPLGAR